MQLVSDAGRWLDAAWRAAAQGAWSPLALAAVGLAGALLVGVVIASFIRAKRRRAEREKALTIKVDREAHALKAELRRRLSEQPKLFDDHLNGAPTLGAREAFEGDIEAAIASVLREAGGERRRARDLLRQRIRRDGTGGAGPGPASGKLNGSEASYWRQLGALAIVDGSRDALIAYRRAADLAPEDAEAQLLLGVLQLRSGNLNAAEQAFKRQIELSSGPETMAARYRGRTMLGDVCAARHAMDEALEAYQSAKGEIEALLELSPSQHTLQRDLSVTCDRIGDVQFSKGEMNQALDSYRTALVLAEGLVRAGQKANPDLLHDLSVSYERIGDLLYKQSDLSGALRHFKKGLAIAKALARSDPANKAWAWDLSTSYERVADVLHAQGHVDEALKTYRRGLGIAEGVVQAETLGDAVLQRDLAVSYHKIGSLEALRGNDMDARDLLEKGRHIIAQLDRIAAHQAQWRSDLSKFDAALKTLH